MSSSTPDWAVQQLALRKEIASWVASCLKTCVHVPYAGGHDEGSFVSSWDGHYLLTGDEDALAFLAQLKSQVAKWFAEELHHGYWPRQEAHHGPEMCCYFLARMRTLLPDDTELRDLFDDAAHHVGNWVEGIPDWYDWETHRFRSWKLGTKEVVATAPFDLNVPDHLKFLHLALPAFLMAGDKRYLEFSRDYAGAWAERLLSADGAIPVVDFPASADPASYNGSAVGVMWGHAKKHQTLAGQLEPHVAAGTIDVLLDLFRLTREERFAAAAKRLAEPLVEFLADPESDPPGTQLLSYRRVTGDTSFDARIAELVTLDREQDLSALAMVVGVDRDPELTGIGKRKDMLKWGYQTSDGMAPEAGPSPTALLLKYEVTGDEEFVARAFAKAAARCRLGRGSLQDGRGHGCSATTMSALMRGHGRNCDVGMATGVLYPACFGSARFCGGMGNRLLFRDAKGAVGLPRDVAVLTRSEAWQACNAGEAAASFTLVETNVTSGEEIATSEVCLAPGEVTVNGG